MMNEAALKNGNADCGATQPASISEQKISSNNSVNNNCSGGFSQEKPAEILRKQWDFFAEFFTLEAIATRAANDDSPPVDMPEMTWAELLAFFAPREAEVVDFQMTKFVKDGGPLSKVISLGSDGQVVSDGSACRMTRGMAFRFWLRGFTGLANFIDSLQSNEAAALGSLPEDRGDSVEIVSQKQLNQLEFADAISRTKKFFVAEKGVPMALLLDHDLKGMPPEVRARLQEMAKTLSKAEQKRFGEKAGFIAAVRSLIEGFDGLGYVLRDSTSGGLYIPATETTPKKEFPSKANCHLYLIIRDGSDAYRAIRALQDRAWLAGFGWHWISKGGHLLKRSIVDITVASPERLIFEGQPIVKPPLAKYPRKSEMREGCLLDSRAIRNLDTSESAALEKLLQASAAALGKELKAARAHVIEDRVKEAVERGVDEAHARKAFSRMFEGEQVTLCPGIVLHFDDPALRGATVRDVLIDPQRYNEKVLADPIEPCGEGDFLLTNKAIFFIGGDHGDPMVFSNLHGGQLYRLRHDADSISALIDSFADGDVGVIDAFAEAMVLGGAESPVTDAYVEGLIDKVMKKAGIKGKKAVTKPLKEAQNKRKSAEKEARENARAAAADAAGGGGDDETLDAPPMKLADFYAFSPKATFICRSTGDHWPAESVNGRVPPIPDGTPKGMLATDWLHANRAVDQMTWSPGDPEIIRDRVVLQGGWTECEGARVYNSYKASDIKLGDPKGAGKWVDHVHRIYPDDADHILDYFAFKVQNPGVKINHAIILGGSPGIGKDTMLEGLNRSIGSANWAETKPKDMLREPYTSYRKSVILRINEVHDLGEFSRYQFYDSMKDLSASGPFALPVRDMYLSIYYIPNVLAAIMTTNHRLVFHIPPDDRRNYFAWGVGCAADFPKDHWTEFYAWYEAGGYENVAAYLMTRDLSHFDPKAPPPKTAWFWESVEISRDSEEGELLDAIDLLPNKEAFTLDELEAAAGVGTGLFTWLTDRKNRRLISIRLEKCGYATVRNPDAKDGLWKVDKARKVIYVLRDMSLTAQMAAARNRTGQSAYTADETIPF